LILAEIRPNGPNRSYSSVPSVLNYNKPCVLVYIYFSNYVAGVRADIEFVALTPPPFIDSSVDLRIEGGTAAEDRSSDHDFKWYSTHFGAYGVIAKCPICQLDELSKGPVTIRAMMCGCFCSHHHHPPFLHLDLQPATSIAIPYHISIMYTTPISRGIAGRNGGPPHSKTFVDAWKVAALGYAKPASEPHYRVEVSDQQFTSDTKAASSLLSNLVWGSCTISATTTFANKGDGSTIGSIDFNSSRLLVYRGEVSRLDSQRCERS